MVLLLVLIQILLEEKVVMVAQVLVVPLKQWVAAVDLVALVLIKVQVLTLVVQLVLVVLVFKLIF